MLLLATVVIDFLTMLRVWLTSKKVATGFATVAAAWLIRRGVTADPVMLAGVFVTGMSVLFGFAMQDHGKEKAKIEAGARVTTQQATSGGTIIEDKPVPPNPAAAPAAGGFTTVALMIVLASIGVLLAIVACGSSLTASGVGHSVLDCSKPSALQATKDYGGAVGKAIEAQLQDDGKLMKPAVEDILIGFATDEAKCVGLNALAKLLTPASPVSGAAASSPRAIDAEDVRAELEKAKILVAPGRAVVLP